MERWKALNLFLVIVIFVIVALDTAALRWHLFFHYWWLDIPMHMLSGFWIALVTLAFMHEERSEEKLPTRAGVVFLVACVSAAAVGLLWETLEGSLTNIAGFIENSDTERMKDLANDLLGAMVAAGVFLKMGYNKAEQRT